MAGRPVAQAVASMMARVHPAIAPNDITPAASACRAQRGLYR
ncbi:hypothetical protein [Gluconacetobacter entanii]|nr:hypothetical protein [Gluconacetobacter entanii]